MIEVDSDGHRSGVRAEDPSLIDIGRALHEGGAALAGVMTHAGASYGRKPPEGLRRIAEQERRPAFAPPNGCAPPACPAPT